MALRAPSSATRSLILRCWRRTFRSQRTPHRTNKSASTKHTLTSGNAYTQTVAKTRGDLFGGVKKAEKALKDTNYLFERIKSGDPAETKGKLITIDPTGLFMTEKDNAKFQVGVNLPAQQAYYVVMNNIEAAAFILAHEIGHRTDTLERDGHDQSGFLSVTNSGRVRDACFAEVPTAIELLRPGF